MYLSCVHVCVCLHVFILTGRRRSNHRALSLQSLTNQNSPFVVRKLNHDDIIERIDGMSPPPSNDSINSSGIDSPTYYGSGTPLDLSNISNRVTSTCKYNTGSKYIYSGTSLIRTL